MAENSARYKQVVGDEVETRYSSAVSGEIAFSRMHSSPLHITTFNAGDIVPLYCAEVLPHDTFSVDCDFVVRQTTSLVPVMGAMYLDVYAFFVPNRVVNQSWKTVMGENPNSSWTATEVSLAPLLDVSKISAPTVSVKIPVGSVADYYGFPTQANIPNAILGQMHDLKFRGYVEIYNQFFRDQNYQPPIPYSKLNIYEDFLHQSTSYNLGPYTGPSDPLPPGGTMPADQPADNSYGYGALKQAVLGNMTQASSWQVGNVRSSSFNALGAPLKANKLHDYFTSVLPSPQKGPQVNLPLAGVAPVLTMNDPTNISSYGAVWRPITGAVGSSSSGYNYLYGSGASSSASASAGFTIHGENSPDSVATSPSAALYPANLYAQLSGVSSATVADLRLAVAVQQTYEQLARVGSRYREYCRGFFGIEVDDPFGDIPEYLGHFRRELDLYQTAQTSASQSGSTAQGTLAAFGYTNSSGKLFTKTFLEHGYVHILGVVRHRNLYSSFLSRDNFRLNLLDYYNPLLANISETPVYTREINPFFTSTDSIFGYQEAWAEYRYDPDYVTGMMRPSAGGSDGQSLAVWNYADPVNNSLSIATGTWLQSNSAEILNRSLAVTTEHQFRGQFRFSIDKERPMPTYSIPGLDIF